jgi:hypothetical protein
MCVGLSLPITSGFHENSQPLLDGEKLKTGKGPSFYTLRLHLFPFSNCVALQAKDM